MFKKAVKPSDGLDISKIPDFRELREGSAQTYSGSELVLTPLHSWITRAGKTPARENDLFELSATVRLSKKQTNRTVNGFFAGPIFYDAAGEIVKWWHPQKPFTSGEKTRKMVIRSTAPEGTASVGIGLCGSWAEADPADFTIAVKSAKLLRVPGKR